MKHPTRWMPVMTALGLLLSMSMPQAADDIDPTRPAPQADPTAVRPDGGAAAGDRRGAGPAVASPATDNEQAAPVLQSLHLPHSGEPSAIISGKLYRVGDRLDGAVIQRIEAAGVTLRGPGGLRALTPYGWVALELERGRGKERAVADKNPLPAWGGGAGPQSAQVALSRPAAGPAAPGQPRPAPRGAWAAAATAPLDGVAQDGAGRRPQPLVADAQGVVSFSVGVTLSLRRNAAEDPRVVGSTVADARALAQARSFDARGVHRAVLAAPSRRPATDDSRVLYSAAAPR